MWSGALDALLARDEQLPPVVQHEEGPDEDGGQLHDGDLVAGGGHAAQAAGGAGELGAHGGEGVGLCWARSAMLAFPFLIAC